MYTFPELQQICENATTIEEVWQMSIEFSRKKGGLVSSFYANKLEECYEMLQPSRLAGLENALQGLKKFLRGWSQEHDCKVMLQRRQKSFIGMNEKMLLYINTEIPLSKLLDLLGIRIVLGTSTKDDAQSVKLLYNFANELMLFLVQDMHCILWEAEPKLDKGFDKSKYPDIYVPEHSFIRKEFQNNVKDYVITPKKRGYQGLHLITKTLDGSTFEIQLRTTAMDIWAEYGEAAHWGHKRDKYTGFEINLDLSKIKIQGFRALESGEIYDTVGLVKSIDPFNLL